jgi:hypothetical protein
VNVPFNSPSALEHYQTQLLSSVLWPIPVVVPIAPE